MNDLLIGILGGMGPEATANLYLNLINSTEVTKDQDHFRVIIDSNAKIPDRTSAILNKGKSPVNDLVATAKNLEKLNVDIGLIPCITAHYYYEDIQKSVNFKVLNALEELNQYLKKEFENIKKVGVLSTSGTIKTNLFNKYLDDFEITYPNEKIQKDYVMEAIYGKKGIKKTKDKKYALNLLNKAAKVLMKQEVDIIIAGCTEIGLVLSNNKLNVNIVDPMDVLIKKVFELEGKNE
ncbi:MAG: aspartate/glutamate racemase family protein [Bacillota bacterium]